MGRLDGRTAIITGGASGIGKATAVLFGREGAAVVIADVDESQGPVAAREIVDAGGRATFVRTDVSREDDVRAMVDATRREYGSVDVLFNNAGIEGDVNVHTGDLTLEQWRRVIDVNMTGVFLASRYCIPPMLEQGRGVIVNNASVAGLVAYPNNPPHAAAKGAVVQMTRTMAIEYCREGIRVNCLCPGVIETPILTRAITDENTRKIFEMISQVGRFGQPEEVASLALFLASDESSYMTGAVIPIDGGYVAR
jgi:NAD(P)-dependent dehydrogenase (short-subunit alcohol dehydrogenase family)